MSPRVQAGITAEDLVFVARDDSYSLQSCGPSDSAPTRFYYPRRDRVDRSRGLFAGWVHAWAPHPSSRWGYWEPIADMRFNDVEEIEQAMRTLARLGLDTGPFTDGSRK